MKEKLRFWLRVNAMFSMACAVCLVFLSLPIAEFVGQIQPLWLQILGGGLLVFVALLLSIGERLNVNLKHVRLVSIMDYSWVLGSILVLLVANDWLTVGGQFSVASIALIVGICGYNQLSAVRAIKNH